MSDRGHGRTETRSAAPCALLSGGGSGGHVFPGLAIAEELEQRGWQVNWAGSRHGLESRLVSRRRIPFHHLPARPVVGQGLAGKLRAAATLARSAWHARSLVRRLDARVVVGTGGYVSAPAVIGARLAARPAFLLEPNAEAGVANRMLSRVADEAAVAFDGAGSRLACPSHTTGVPIRSEFFQPTAWPTAPPWRLLVLGGSQGAQQINQLMPQALEILSGRLESLIVCHQTGEKHVEETREAYRAAGIADISSDDEPSATIRSEVVPFVDRMAEAMSRSHLIVSRAGAITLAEICATGRPSLLVPLALADGHQADNARRLADAGAAAVLSSSATAEDLAETLESLLTDDTLRKMAIQASALAHPDAAAAIADRVERVGRRRHAASLEEAS